MKTKKYLERLLKNEAVLSGNVAQSAYRRVDFDVDAAVEFANAAALNMLIKLSKLAKLFEAHYAETGFPKENGADSAVSSRMVGQGTPVLGNFRYGGCKNQNQTDVGGNDQRRQTACAPQ